MCTPSILIAGIGNIFFGDDAFGSEVSRRLDPLRLPEGVRVVDFGIRGLDLTYALLDGYEAVILVDAVQRGGPPGTLYVLEPDPGEPSEAKGASIETHGMDPVKVLRLVAAMGGQVKRLLVVGCEPTTVGDGNDMCMEMSDPVSAAVGEAVSLVESLVAKLLRGEAVEAR